MNAQLNLFDTPIAPTVQPRRAIPGQSIEAQFLAFHEANPHVYNALRDLSLAWRRRGSRKIGMKMLFEVLRWKFVMTTDDPDSSFKLNNNYAPYYARTLMDNEPQLDGVFEIRELRAVT